MNILITGSTGFVGQRLAERLLKDGHRVIGAARSRHVRCLVRQGLVEAPEIAAAIFDGAEPSPAVTTALGEVDWVFHLAGDATFGNGPQYRLANVEPTRRLVELLRRHGRELKVLVFASTIGAQDRDPEESINQLITERSRAMPTTDYGRSKLEAEAVLMSSGLPIRIARLGMVVGKDMRPGSHVAVVADTARKIPAAILGQLGGVLPLIHLDDACNALEFLASSEDADTEPYLIVADNVSVAQVVDVLLRRESSEPMMPRVARAAKPFRAYLPFKLRSMVLPELAVSSDRLRELGWKPEVQWQQAVREVGERAALRHDVEIPPPGWTVVTGAGSGLGRAAARRLSKMGRTLVLVDRDETSLETVRFETGAVLALVADVSAPTAMSDLVAQVDGRGGHISELFLCAGMGRKGHVGSVDASTELRSIDVNLRARVAASVEVLPEMAGRNFGRIVLISSSSAFQALPKFAAYGASNAGLLNFGQALAAETIERGIKVITVCPGGMDTNFQANAGVRRLDGERLLSPDEVVNATLRGLASNAQVVVVGRTAKAMDLASRILPRPVQARLWSRLVSSRR